MAATHAVKIPCSTILARCMSLATPRQLHALRALPAKPCRQCGASARHQKPCCIGLASCQVWSTLAHPVTLLSLDW